MVLVMKKIKKHQERKIKLLEVFIVIVIAQIAGFLGSIFTTSSINSWYNTLNKPSWNPPNWIFAPVWTTLFTFMGIASYLIWQNKKNPFSKKALDLYSIHLILNILWSVFFFGLKNPLLALVEIVFLWLIILILIFKFYKINKTAAYLMIPYLAWVSFATILNASIVFLN